MKVSFHQFIVRTALGAVLVTTSALVAQTAPTGGGGAPSGGGTPSGGTTRSGGTTTAPRSGSGATTTAPNAPTGGTGAQPAASGSQPVPNRNQLPNQPGTTTNPAGATTTQPGTTVNPNEAGQTITPPGTRRTGAGVGISGAPAGRNSSTSTTTPGTLQDGSTVNTGAITNFTGSGFTLTDASGRPINVLLTPATSFVDFSGNAIPSSSFSSSFGRGRRTPATVYYNQGADGNLVASRVVVSEPAPTPAEQEAAAINAAGTVTEVSPGILVIEQPGASDTPVRYVNNKTTNYVNENGEPVPPESVKPGTPVKIFYTKVGDTLVASRVEVRSGDKSGLPAPPIKTEQTTTTTRTKEEK